MSYVIQHFYQPSQEIIFNPRLKLLLNCKNIVKLFLFFRLNFTMFNLNFFLSVLSPKNLTLYSFYFFKHIHSLDYLFTIKLTANHTIKFHKNLSFYGLQTLLSLFLNNNFKNLNIFIENVWFFNLCYFTIKTVKFPILKKFYKNVFLLLLLQSIFQWQACTNKIIFNPMYFFIFYQLQVAKFYNRKFFKIFNI